LKPAKRISTRARLKLISKIPDLQAAYVFNAGQAKPAWDGMAGMKPLKDFFGPGADGVNLEVGIESDEATVRDSAIYWS